jgi:hypothetical protein
LEINGLTKVGAEPVRRYRQTLTKLPNMRPTVVAVEIALPFGEQVEMMGWKSANFYARTEIRVSHPHNARRIIGNVMLVR